MKKIIISLLFCISLSLQIKAQNCEIPLMVVIPDQIDYLPPSSESYLKTKLTNMTTEIGMSAGSEVTQFAIVPQINLVGKDMIVGPPRMVSLDMDMTLYITDMWGEKVFSSTTINLKGVGTNETKAYIDGIKKINAKSQNFQQFIKQGKDKLIQYYDNNYTTIFNQARSLAKQKQFEEALYLLTSIPPCSKGYQSSLAETDKIYQAYVDDLCHQYLNKARMAWASSQDAYGASEAGNYLEYIYPDAKCYGDAMSLYKEIKGKILSDWKFEMKMYNDQISLEKQRINAWKEVGVAFGKGQKARTTNVHWIVR